MRIVHDPCFGTEEIIAYKPVIQQSLLQSLQEVLKAMRQLGIRIEDVSREDDAREFLSRNFSSEKMRIDEEMARAVKVLWADGGVQECFRRSSEYQLNDSAKYYLDASERVLRHGYVPTQEDILRAYVKFTGIVKAEFPLDLIFKIFDIGEQESHMKKWLHCFENVAAVLFCVALSDYDLKVAGNTNRMEESMELFESVCNNPYFIKSGTGIVLLLNKTDIFKEKLPNSPLSLCFPEYGGNNSFEDASVFIKQQFLKRNMHRRVNEDIHIVFTCAIETEFRTKPIVKAVRDSVIIKNLRETGFH